MWAGILVAAVADGDRAATRIRHVLRRMGRLAGEFQKREAQIDQVNEHHRHVQFDLVKIGAVVGDRAQVLAPDPWQIAANHARPRLGRGRKKLPETRPQDLIRAEAIARGPLQGFNHTHRETMPHGIEARRAL